MRDPAEISDTRLELILRFLRALRLARDNGEVRMSLADINALVEILENLEE